MAKVTLDTIEGSSASHKLIEGYAITVGAMIEDLDVAANTGSLITAAENALIAVVGNRGAPCPGITVINYLDEFSFQIHGPTTVRARIIYRGYRHYVYEYRTALSSIPSNTDVNGVPIIRQYKYPDTYRLDPNKAGQVYTQGGIIQKQVPETVVTLKFTVVDGFQVNGVPVTAVQAASWLSSFNGGINNAPYSIYLIIGAAHQWLLTVDAVTADGGFTYDVTIMYQFRTEGWDTLCYFNNPDDGQPPSDLKGPGAALPGGQTSVGYGPVQGNRAISFPTFTFAPN